MNLLKGIQYHELYPEPSTGLIAWQHRNLRHLSRSESANFVSEGPDNKYFRLVSYRVSVAITQICYRGGKAARRNLPTNDGSVLIKLYLQK